MPEVTAAVLVGIDVGSSRVRALAVDAVGTVLADEGVPTPVLVPRPGWAEHEAEALWQAVATVLRRVVAQLPAGRPVIGLAVASMGEAAVAIDRDGRPTHPVIAWYDHRTTYEVALLEARIGRERLARITGLSLDPTLGLAKLLWVKANAPDALARTRHWLSIADWIAYRLTGIVATDFSLASRTLALDLTRGVWADDLIRELDLDPSLFPPLAPSGARLGTVTADAARATGLPAGAPVGIGGHDHIVGALAAGVTEPGIVLDSLGTAEVLMMALAAPLPGAEPAVQGFYQGRVKASPDLDLAYILGSIPTSGGSVEWFRRVHGFGLEHATLIDEARLEPAGAGGVAFLPHLRLACVPRPDSRARGAFIGLSADTRRGALFRAVLEGLAMEARLALDSMARLPNAPVPGEIRAIGGSTRNQLLLQIKAAAFARPLTRLSIAETTGLGAALLGGIAADVFSGVTAGAAALGRPGDVVEPDPAAVALYEALYTEVHARLYEALRPLHYRLQALTRAAAPLA